MITKLFLVLFLQTFSSACMDAFDKSLSALDLDFNFVKMRADTRTSCTTAIRVCHFD